MAELSIMIEGQDGVNWAIWKRLVNQVEALGFAGLFRFDHYTNPSPPEKDSLEMVVSLAYLADNTRRTDAATAGIEGDDGAAEIALQATSRTID